MNDFLFKESVYSKKWFFGEQNQNILEHIQ